MRRYAFFGLILINTALSFAQAPQREEYNVGIVRRVFPVQNADNPIILASGATRQELSQPLSLAANPTTAKAAGYEPIVRSALLRQLRCVDLEKCFASRLEGRCIAVANTDAAAQYRLRASDGSSVELQFDKPQNIVTASGSPRSVEGILRIVSLYDQNTAGRATELMPFNGANLKSVSQLANVVENAGVSAKKTAKKAAKIVQVQFEEADNEFSAAATDSAANAEAAIGAATAAGLIGPVQVEIVADLDVVVLRGNRKDVAVVMDLIKQIEATSQEQEPIIEHYFLENADSLRVTSMLTTLYNTVYLSRRGTVSATALVKPNAILLIGRKESVETAKELIKKLDLAVPPENEYKVIHLKNAAAETVTSQVTSFYSSRQPLGTQVVIVADYRTNSVIIQANPRDLVEITSMIRNLDSNEGPENQMKIVPLKNAMAETLATILQNAFTGTGTTGVGTTTSSSNQQRRNAVLSFERIDRESGGVLKSGLMTNDIRVTAVAQNNSLLVSAPAESMPLIEAVIASLDTLPSIESQIKVFTIVNGDASSLVTMLRSIFQSASTGTGTTSTSGASVTMTSRPGLSEDESALVPVRLAVEVRTNSIVAIGSAGDLMTVESILLSLDEEDMQNRKVMVYRLLNSPASNVATAIQAYITGEQQVDRTTAELRGVHELARRSIIVTAEPISNSLIICTTPHYFDEIRRIVRHLDERPPLVSIDVLIADISMTDGCSMGVELGLQDSILFHRSSPVTGLPGFLFGSAAQALGNNTAAANPNQVGTQGITSLGTNRSDGGFVFSASSESVSVLIQAMEQRGRVHVLSRPQITTLHNQSASVLVGQAVPIVTGTNMDNGNISNSVDEKNVGLQMQVTPRVSADGLVVMEITATKSKLGDEKDGVVIAVQDGEPLRRAIVDTTTVQTTVSAKSGQTVVLGGMLAQSSTHFYKGIPVISRIPVLGKLFQSNSRDTVRTEMVVIMTPTVLRNEYDMEYIKQKELSRIHWCARDVAKMTDAKIFRRSDYDGLEGRVVIGSELTMDGVITQEHSVTIPSQPPVLDDNNLPLSPRMAYPMPNLAP